MSVKDREKWDTKYTNTPKLLQPREPSKKVVNFIDKLKGKKVLDVACGSGRNSIYLAHKGFEVDAIDISKVALDTLKSKNIKNIHTKLIDLDNYLPEENCYDLIIKCNYLQRDIIAKLSNALKKNGILIIETYMSHASNTKPNSNPDFLLQKDELKSFFDDNFEILQYDEFDNEPYEIYKMKKQSIVVRKI
jgi:SAM-dependent methyltransferase